MSPNLQRIALPDTLRLVSLPVLTDTSALFCKSISRHCAGHCLTCVQREGHPAPVWCGDNIRSNSYSSQPSIALTCCALAMAELKTNCCWHPVVLSKPETPLLSPDAFVPSCWYFKACQLGFNIVSPTAVNGHCSSIDMIGIRYANRLWKGLMRTTGPCGPRMMPTLRAASC